MPEWVTSGGAGGERKGVCDVWGSIKIYTAEHTCYDSDITSSNVYWKESTG